MEYKDFQKEKPSEINLDGKRIKFKSNPPANYEEIQDLENIIGIKLPESIINIYLSFNGAEFFNYDNIDGFRLFSLENIRNEIENAKIIYEKSWDCSIILLMEMIGEGNLIGIKTKDNKELVVDCFHEVDPKEWKVIEQNIDVFMKKLFHNDGRKYWLDQV